MKWAWARLSSPSLFWRRSSGWASAGLSSSSRRSPPSPTGSASSTRGPTSTSSCTTAAWSAGRCCSSTRCTSGTLRWETVVRLSACLCVSVCLYPSLTSFWVNKVSVCLSDWLSVSLNVSVCPSGSFCVCVSLCLSVLCLSLSWSACRAEVQYVKCIRGNIRFQILFYSALCCYCLGLTLHLLLYNTLHAPAILELSC